MPVTHTFEPLPSARFKTEFRDGIEWIVVRARKNWFALPFLCLWLTGWTLGGGAAFYAFLTGETGERAFLALWLVGWAVGWIFASTWILWQLGGRSMVAVSGGALIHAWRMPMFSREKRYNPAEVRNLRSGDTGGIFGWGRSMSDVPPFFPSMSGGSVKFDYGAKTVQLFPGLDEAEGQMIVTRIAAQLPLASTRQV